MRINIIPIRELIAGHPGAESRKDRHRRYAVSALPLGLKSALLAKKYDAQTLQTIYLAPVNHILSTSKPYT